MTEAIEAVPVRRILVVHAEEALRRALPVLLLEAGVQVAACEDPREAVGWLAREAYALVVVGADPEPGKALSPVHILREAAPGVPIVLVADQIEMADLLQAFPLRIADVFEGRMDQRALAERLGRLLGLDELPLPEAAVWERLNAYLGWPSFDREAQRIHGAYRDLQARVQAETVSAKEAEALKERFQEEECEILLERQQLADERSRLEGELDKLRQDQEVLEQLANETGQRAEALAKKENELELRHVEQEEMRSMLECAQAEQQHSLEAEKELLQVQMDEFFQRRERSEKDLGERTEALAGREAELEELARVLDERQTAVAGLEEKVADMDRREAAIRQASDELEEGREIVAAERRSLSEKSQELAKEREAVNAAQTRSQAETEELLAAQLEFQSASRSLDDAKADWAKQAAAERERLQAERAELDSQCVALEQSKAAFAIEREQVKQQVSELEASRRKLDAERLLLVDDEAELSRRGTELDERQRLLEAEALRIEERSTRLDDEVEERLEAENLVLRQATTAAEREKARAAAEVEKLRELRQQLVNEHQRVTAARASLLAERRRLLQGQTEDGDSPAAENPEDAPDPALMESLDEAVGARD